MDQITHGCEILDLIWCNNSDLVCDTNVTPYPEFTDHNVIVAATSYKLKEEVKKEPQFLLDSGRRMKMLDFPKAPWPDLQARLGLVDWTPMEEKASELSESSTRKVGRRV